MKTLLVISGAAEAVPVARRAKELGYYVVVSDREVDAPAFAFSDSCLIADASAPDETAAAAERFSRKIRKIDGVIAMTDGAATVASAATRLGLPGISGDLASALSDRLALWQRLLAAGIPIPWFSPVATVQALERVAIERGPNLVIRPVEGLVPVARRIAGAQQIEEGFAWARRHSPSQRVLVEEYLEGAQIFAESLVAGGRCYTPALADRYESTDGHAGPFGDHGWELPSRLPAESQAIVKRVIAQTAAALGIGSGVIGCEIAMRGEESCVTGVATGLSGVFATQLIPLCSGVDFVGAAIRSALGDGIAADELEPKRSIPVVQICASTPSGFAGSIPGIEEARKIPGVEQVSVNPGWGEKVPRNGGAGAVITAVATGSSHEAALGAARKALSLFPIDSPQQASNLA